MVLDHFGTVLKEMIGLDIESVGRSAIERAVRERQAACGLDDPNAYWDRVRASEAERQWLVDAAIVPETWFFRDREAFAALARLVHCEWMPAHPDGVLRILSVPCSSGEEPYSIAMALRDAGVDPERFRIDATDVSTRVIAKARQGIYGQNSFRGADLAFRDRHFEPCSEGYRLAEPIRGLVNVQHGNLLAASFMDTAEPYDVIFCRNLFIYFDRATQERAIAVLKRLLTPAGFLFVGSSETGVFMNHDFVSARLPMAFAFRRRHSANPRRGEAGEASPTQRRPTQPAARSVPARAMPSWSLSSVSLASSVSGKPPAGSAAAVIRSARATPIERRASEARRAIDEAYRLADQGHFAEAARNCEDHLRQDGPSARAFYLLGLVRDASGNGSDAESFYRKALYLDPGHREALVHLALLMDRQGRKDDAQVLRNRVRRLELAPVAK